MVIHHVVAGGKGHARALGAVPAGGVQQHAVDRHHAAGRHRQRNALLQQPGADPPGIVLRLAARRQVGQQVAAGNQVRAAVLHAGVFQVEQDGADGARPVAHVAVQLDRHRGPVIPAAQGKVVVAVEHQLDVRSQQRLQRGHRLGAAQRLPERGPALPDGRQAHHLAAVVAYQRFHRLLDGGGGLRLEPRHQRRRQAPRQLEKPVVAKEANLIGGEGPRCLHGGCRHDAPIDRALQNRVGQSTARTCPRQWTSDGRSPVPADARAQRAAAGLAARSVSSNWLW